MRLKQFLGILSLLLVLSTMAAASGSQLTDVAVKAQGNTTTLTIHASSAFTHTEYRPTDNLLLVDLAGVSAANLENQTREFKGQFPGIESYHVVAYKGTSGATIARVEIGLAPNAVVNIADGTNAVSVRIQGQTPVAAAAQTAPVTAKIESKSAPVATKAEAKPAPLRANATSKPVQIRKVSVVRGKDGINVEIIASGAIAPTAMNLTAPDRIVVDVPNAIPAPHQKEIAVNSNDVKSIRISRYQLNPPVTRIVVDLNKSHTYDMANAGSHAVLRVHGASPSPVMNAQKAAEAPKPQNLVMVEPVYSSRPATKEEVAAVQTPSERAADAASKFSARNSEVPVTNSNAALTPQPAINLAMMQQQQNASAPAAGQPSSVSCSTGRYNGEPISVNLKEVDLRDFFRLVHDISGLNVVLDPQVKGTLTMVLDDVPWDQALSIVLKNNSLECELEGNVLRIATTATLKKEADDRRAQLDAQANAVDMITINRYLSYAVAKDVAATMKTFLTTRGTVIADDRTNSLIISDIPTVMPNIDRQIKELDRKTQEVEIEARVVAATRNFARDLGVQLGFGWNNQATSVLGAGGANSPIVSSRPFNGGIVPLFSNLGAGAVTTSGLAFTNAGSNYRLDAILTMAESRGLLKILSRPRVVTQNNVQAVVKQGQRIPIVTGAQLGGPPTVVYFEALLRLTVKPQITAENTIFLNVDVENTTPDFSRTTPGQPNPALTTQQATTQVLVSDGGTVMIGGVIQTTSSVAISQVPLLGSIPVFGNLFKRRSVNTSSTELIFFLTPKIIQT